MACVEEPNICILKTSELMSKAQLLMCDIEEMLDWCTSTGPSDQRWCRKIQQDCHVSIEEDGETLIIGGFRFESAASREDLRRLRSQTGGGAVPHLSDGYLSGFITQSQQGQATGRGNDGRQRANK